MTTQFAARNQETLFSGEPDQLLAQALAHLQKAASLKGRTASHLFSLAQAQFLAGQYLEAEEACQVSLETDPDNYDSLLLLAEIQLRLRKSPEAWKTAKFAIKLHPEREEAWLIAARSAVESDQNRKAVEILELYFKTNDGKLTGPLASILQARVYLNLDEPENAMAQLEQAQARLKALYITPGPAFQSLKGRVLSRLGRREESLNYYQQALKQNPLQATLHNELGESLLEEGRLDEALKAFRQALELEPRNAVYHNNAGKVSLELARTAQTGSKRGEAYQKQAAEHFGRATELDSFNPDYWYQLAQAQALSRSHTLVKNSLEQALKMSPPFKEAGAPQVNYLRLFASTCQKLGDFAGARKALNQILEAIPGDHETLNHLGEISFWTGDYGLAYNYFRKAELASPDHAHYLANMSRVLQKLDRLEEAHDLANEAFQSQASNHFVRHQFGSVLLAGGKPKEALEHLREAASRDPENGEFRYQLARAYLQLGMVSEAIEEYRAAVSASPNQHAWYAELSELYLKERIHASALDTLYVAVKLDPANPTYRFNLAIAQGANGDLWGGVHTLREVINSLGEEAGPEWHYLLGRLLLSLGKTGEALESFNVAHNLEPQNPEYKVDLARTLRLKGEPIEQVKTLLQEAVAANPGELRSVDELAYALEADKDHEAAIQALETHLDEVLGKIRGS